MQSFTRTTFLIAGLLAAVTSIGVYGATAGNSVAFDRPAALQADSQHTSHEEARNVSEVKSTRAVRIVGPRFFPDNGDIKLRGASESLALAD